MCMEPLSAGIQAAAAGSRSPGRRRTLALGASDRKAAPKRRIADARLLRNFAPRGARAKFESRAVGCYNVTVNESETINEAQPLCRTSRPQRGRPARGNHHV